MAAKLHEEASAVLLEATSDFEGAIMMGDATERARVAERYASARAEYAATMAQLARARRENTREALSVLADPMMSCDPNGEVLASIVEFAAAQPASAGLDVRRASRRVYQPVDSHVAAQHTYTRASHATGDRRFGFPLTAAR
jgi:hypothetical protein